MDRSGRLFSFDEGSSDISLQVTANSAPSAERVQPTSNLTSDEVSLKLQDAASADPDFVDVVLAAALYGIPSKSINTIGFQQPGSDDLRQVYTVGSGLTSEVVQHTVLTTKQRSESERPQSTTIALKIFQSTRLAHPNKAKAARQKVYNSILNEMKAFSHPLLSNHPNILKLLFIGWNLDQPYPFLGTELGDYGSLDYVIRTWGASLTVRQKRNITIDIALGLQVIHHAGMTHGDLKPDNIIIFSHEDPTRQVVAKLMDFGGSDEIQGNIFGKPTHFTPFWCAPEVMGKHEDIPWDRADLYSYGLVVASLWAGIHDEGETHYNNDKPQGASVLSGSVPLASNEDNERLIYLKGLPENHPDSVMSVLKKRLTRKTLPAGIDPPELFAILTPTLKTDWWQRPDRKSFMEIISDFAHTIGRAIETLLECKDFKASNLQPRGMYKPNIYLQVYRPRAFRDSIFEQSFQWAFRATEYRDIITKHMVEALDEINRRIEYVPRPNDIPGDLPQHLSTDQFLANLLAKTEDQLTDLLNVMKGHATAGLWPNMIDFIKKGYFSYNLGISGLSSLRESPTPGLRKGALEHIRISSLCEHGLGIMTATFAFTGSSHESEIPVRLNLTLLALSHSSFALRRLHSKWPGLHAMVCRVLRERGLNCLEDAKAILPGLYESPQLVRLYCAQPTPLSPAGLTPLTLEEALEVGASEMAREILEGLNDTVSAETEQTVQKLFYKLCKLPDVDASAIARTAYERGASLDCAESATTTHISNMPVSGKPLKPFSPLCVALMWGMPKLAFEIVCLHVEFDMPILHFSTALQLSFANLYPEIAEVLLRLYQDNRDMCICGDEDFDFDGWLLIVPQMDGNSMACALSLLFLDVDFQLDMSGPMMLHGGDYEAAYAKTLKFFLDESAGPVWGFCGDTPLGFSIISDDVTALKLYIKHLETISVNDAYVCVDDIILAVLTDPCSAASLFNEAPWQYMNTALALCLRHGSLRSFKFLLEKFPGLVAYEVDYSGKTLLHRACSGTENLVDELEVAKHPSYLLYRAGSLPDGITLEFVDLLLGAGADVMATDQENHTPLYWALLRANIPVADRIASHCSQDQLNYLLGRDPVTGGSLFESLVEADVSKHHTGKQQRQPRLVDSLRWLEKRGAVYYYGPGSPPFYTMILSPAVRTARTDQLLDAALMEYLIDLPLLAEGLQREHHAGKPLIFGAVMNGNVEIVRMLLDRKCDPNGGYDPSVPGSADLGRPLDYVAYWLLNFWNALSGVEHASEHEFRRWQDRMVDIASLLIDKGGKGEIFYWQAETCMKRQPDRGSSGERNRLAESIKQQAVLGVWPKPPPSDGVVIDAPATSKTVYLPTDMARHLLQTTFARIEEKRLGLLGAKRQLLFIEGFYAEAARGRSPEKGNSEASSQSSPEGTLSNARGEQGLPDSAARLHRAVHDSDVGRVRSALDSIDDVDAEDDHGHSPLDSALLIKATHIRTAIVQLLLLAGADPNRVRASSSLLSTPLHRCIQLRDDPELVDILVAAGAHVNRSNGKHSPLMLAVCWGRRGALSRLLSAGADITQRDAEGQSLVHLAVIYGKPAILSTLLGFLDSEQPEVGQERLVNANIEAICRDNDGDDAAGLQGQPKPHETLQPGRAPIHLAAYAGAIPIMRILINEGGADPNVKDDEGMTALHHAVLNAPFEVVEMLIDEAGADIHARDNGQATPLVRWVIKYGRDKRSVDTRIRDLLLARGANVNDLAEFQFIIRADGEHGFSYHHVGKGKEGLVSAQTPGEGSGALWVEWVPWTALGSR